MSLDDSPEALRAALSQLREQHKHFVNSELALDLTRGKPATAQLDLSNALLGPIDSHSAGTDLRNYGGLDGLPAAKALCAELLGIAAETAQARLLVGGNSSLSLMHAVVSFANFLGLAGQAWSDEKNQTGQATKILCPSPGYDRHFAICEQLGIEMLVMPLTGQGPDMDALEKAAQDHSVKGIWCVPRFSNPSGEVYSDATVARLAALPKIAANNFLVLWDNAYALHAFHDKAPALASIEHEADKAGTLNQVVQFGSTSKMTFAGSGISYLASSETTKQAFAKHLAKVSIGPDKLNQQRHVNLLKDAATAKAHMRRHAEILAPKFNAVLQALDAGLAGCNMGDWSEPEGGYFVSFDARPGLANKIVALAAEAGVKLTPAGATFPYGRDPEDRNIRLAPSFPALEEVQRAAEVFVNCVQIASLEDALSR
ncbi:MAG: aminotransferase class I/II-fold pyridoxal phosphate-dependent enzyme [Gammaproteobacteria bacterium]|nr:aminotransferase class I/II-fold pyridoxal phosphate-dependent enzyme [Gammaproteobacteria bacterium]NNM11686.1 aminotransferase class I/II-fold pyridoxal phosphate-dependent enzyme [Pseudomonadales bacterium]RZV54406.1 MAG: aminotransferase class I/II-fold pyridoxal phosphate-dependent enzyme [Pseudomonadales bacterium]